MQMQGEITRQLETNGLWLLERVIKYKLNIQGLTLTIIERSIFELYDWYAVPVFGTYIDWLLVDIGI